MNVMDTTLSSLTLVYDVTPASGRLELPSEIRFDAAAALRIVNREVPLGLWRAELETGHFHVSAQCFRIFGLEPQEGPANIVPLSRAFHPDDYDMMMSLLEAAARQKCGFQYVLRVENGKGGYKYVRAVSQYKERPDGAGELSGILHEIPENV